jgi:hypothetical protein
MGANCFVQFGTLLFHNNNMSQLQELNTAIAQFKKDQNALKERFIKAIKDKSTPVQERWEFWCDAPSSLKDFSQFSIKFDCMGKNFSWYDDMLISRNETVDLEDLIWNLEQYVDHQCDDPERYFVRKLFRNRPLLDQLLEEILARNLEYFVYAY